jgi:rRNA processing protein Krr1/Pno1
LHAEEKKFQRTEELKAKAGKFAAALKAGFSAEEALKLLKES